MRCGWWDVFGLVLFGLLRGGRGGMVVFFEWLGKEGMD